MSVARHVAVWIASIVFFVLGAIWYSVMAAPWMAAIGKTMDELTREQGASPLPYIVGFAAILVMCYTLAWLMHRLQAATLAAGGGIGWRCATAAQDDRHDPGGAHDHRA